jgi:hypothetical protein
LGYWSELQRVERDIADLSVPDPFAAPIDSERLTRYIYLLYQRASLTGDLAQLSAAGQAIERAVPLLTHPGDLYLLKAHIAFKLHRLDNVERALLAIPTAGQCVEACLLRADLDFSAAAIGTPRQRTLRRSKRGGRGVVLPAWRIFVARWAIPKVPTACTRKPKTN